jgi:hypothetical protein
MGLMSSETPTPRLRNYRSRTLNRSESLWQIGIPVGAAAVIAIVLMVLVSTASAAPVRSPLADISLIFLIGVAAFTGLIVLALLVLCCGAAWYAFRELPYYLWHAQNYAALASVWAQLIASKVEEPFLRVHSVLAGGRKAGDILSLKFTRSRRAE